MSYTGPRGGRYRINAKGRKVYDIGAPYLSNHLGPDCYRGWGQLGGKHKQERRQCLWLSLTIGAVISTACAPLGNAALFIGLVVALLLWAATAP